MKNRTVIGVICMVLAVVMTFAVAPLVNRLTSDTSEAIRLAKDVKQGVQITAEDLESVTVKTDSIPAGVVNEGTKIIGKYAASKLYAGDYLFEDKLTGEANTANDAFASLDGTKLAMSVTIDTFAAGLSGKLENGDVVSMVVLDKNSGKATIPAALKYMKVITTTTSGGIDQDMVVKNEDGSFEIPSTVPLLVNSEQAKLLAKYDADNVMTVALVYRGTPENAKKFLDTQDEYFLSPEYEEEKKAAQENEKAAANGDDPVKRAGEIVAGDAEYYHVGGDGNE